MRVKQFIFLWFSSLKVVYIKEEPQCDVAAETGIVVDSTFIKENDEEAINVLSESVVDPYFINKNAKKANNVKSEPAVEQIFMNEDAKKVSNVKRESPLEQIFIQENSVNGVCVKSESVSIKENAAKNGFNVKSEVRHSGANNSLSEAVIQDNGVPDNSVSKCRVFIIIILFLLFNTIYTPENTVSLMTCSDS